ncbi:pyruvate phosphate dikinase [Magnetococcus marinus MC-1]|uniref:Pyruvate phosphate dikinase n=1 Tax=Magnetococcus marinus (strain ATCC BAA-1437 / JCM 17883 / MC-1) TaxID=156889 RepID=A0LAA5_MAGMM|nr:PEP/pyruvate-binding domain-containing protein [Magnetococcus marinus]ABK44898.1 pyruvate phosphate dikinase [Magnetococcus marinus MC-1]
MPHRSPIQSRPQPPLQSDALRANLAQTAVAAVEIPPHQQPLLQVVEPHAGIYQPLEQLLKELNHPFRNWRLLLPEWRAFVLKNLYHYLQHPLASTTLPLLGAPFFQALDDASQSREHVAALGAMCAYIEKLAQAVTPQNNALLQPCIEDLLGALQQRPDAQFCLLAQTHHPLKRAIKRLLEIPETPITQLNWQGAAQVMQRHLRLTYAFWLQQEDPSPFTTPLHGALFTALSHPALYQQQKQLERLAERHPPHGATALAFVQGLLELPDAHDMVRLYGEAGNRLSQSLKQSGDAHTERANVARCLQFLFRILENEGLTLLHEKTLREVNQGLVRLLSIAHDHDQTEAFFIRTFESLNHNVLHYPRTALQCIEALGSKVIQLANPRLVELFLEQAVGFGFQHSCVAGVDAQWKTIANPAHLHNIRVWLALIGQQPKWCSTLLSALIINIKLTGTLIRDTDLFQKDISKLLNSEVEPVYNLVKQFARLLPVYYNDIGAEGALRDVSTQLDEIHHRQDPLIHFLRKQCHVESTNLIVPLTAAVIRYWQSGEPAHVAPYLSEPVRMSLLQQAPLLEGVQRVMAALFDQLALQQPEALLNLPLTTLSPIVQAVDGVEASEKQRVLLLIELYQLVEQKYNPGFAGVLPLLQRMAQLGVAEATPLLQALEQGTAPTLPLLLEAMEGLKRLILDPQQHAAQEEIFQKRHIAVGIPSVYGRYSEPKFDALALIFRLERQATALLDGLTANVPEAFVTRATITQVIEDLSLFQRALRLDGIKSRKLRNDLLVVRYFVETNPFTYHQFLDLFRSLSQVVKGIIYTHYTSHHRDNMARIIPTLPAAAMQSKYAALLQAGDTTGNLERVNESFMRDLIAETFSLQALDNYLGRVLKMLHRQLSMLDAQRAQQLLTYDPTKLFCPIHHPNMAILHPIHLGNKGYNLARLVVNGAPVPAGTILTTEFFRCHRLIHDHPPAWQDFMARLRAEMAALEQQTGLGFADPQRPLLVSVRSGALISMPGMMQTIHNVGINETIVAGLSQQSGNAFFAWDTYRRFIQSWCMAHDVERGVFSDIMRSFKQQYGVKKKGQFSAEQMRQLAFAYRDAARGLAITLPEEPWQQLLAAIELVLASWHGEKAHHYRAIMDLSDAWGTAVVIQKMIYGNLLQSMITEETDGAACPRVLSGTGVLFTAHPYRKLTQVMLWGDYTPGNQGEDIVGGLVSTWPISMEQCYSDHRDPQQALEHRFPLIYQGLLELAKTLIYTRDWNHQEIEFTFDGPTVEHLHILQTRNMITRESLHSVVSGFKLHGSLKEHLIGQGIGVHGGALCGRAAFNLEQIETLRQTYPSDPLILIRYDTVSDDIKEISQSQGLLTARGGQTSHAAIVAASLQKTCVVGCESMRVWELQGYCKLDGVTVKLGDAIAIDGHNGHVLRGWHEIERTLY